MKIKFLKLTWDLKPILAFLWGALVIAMICMAMVHGSDDEIWQSSLYIIGTFLWVYINHTLASNGIIK